MSANGAIRLSATEHRFVLGCVPDAHQRAAIQTALRDHARIEWVESFAEVKKWLQGSPDSTTVVISARDSAGEWATSFAAVCRTIAFGTPIVVCCNTADPSLADLATVGAHGLLLGDLADQAYLVRSVILGALVSAAGDLVMRDLENTIPLSLVPFVDAAVRRPRTVQRVNDVAAALQIPRQTLCRWCREQHFVRPEELLVWSRLFLVATLLETTTWTLEAISRELAYGSPTALRNRVRTYTRMTSTEIRSRGIKAVVRIFEDRVESERFSSSLSPVLSASSPLHVPAK